jgi:hypothetical protein
MKHVSRTGVTVCLYIGKDSFEVPKAVSVTVTAFEVSLRVLYWKITRDSELIFCHVEP